MSTSVVWFILGMTFLLLTAGTICFIVLMYWLSSSYSNSKLPGIVKEYLEQRGRARGDRGSS